MPAPDSLAAAADVVRALGEEGRTVAIRGGGSKASWGGPLPADEVPVETTGLTRIVEHNEGDFTAILEAGVPLAIAQDAFREAGQMLAVDPPLGERTSATIGGLVATADSGPLRHRYGGVRDIVLGTTVVLSDGTVASSGGKVIKNVAGYDLGKLFTGSFGTLGLIASVSLRLHPLPALTETALGESDDPARLVATVAALARRPLEAQSLDVRWEDGAGRVMVRFGGATADRQARDALPLLRDLENARLEADDEPMWEAQRTGQRSPDGAVLKVAARPTDLARVLEAARDTGATAVARAALGLTWLAFDDATHLAEARRALSDLACTVLDGADRIEDPWPEVPAAALAVMERLKARFDPARCFRPGTFAGGI